MLTKFILDLLILSIFWGFQLLVISEESQKIFKNLEQKRSGKRKNIIDTTFYFVGGFYISSVSSIILLNFNSGMLCGFIFGILMIFGLIAQVETFGNIIGYFFAGLIKIIIKITTIIIVDFTEYASDAIESILCYFNLIKLEPIPQYIPFSIASISDEPLDLYFSSENSIVEKLGTLIPNDYKDCDLKEFLLLKDNGSTFSIGKFTQSLEDGFFYSKLKDSPEMLYIKKDSKDVN